MTVLSVCIIGGGLAGSTAAHRLGAVSRVAVTVIDEDPDSPYDRPPLTKRLLQDKFEANATPAWAAAGDINWRHDRVLRIDPLTSTVRLESGADLAPDIVVIATGGRPRTQSSNTWGFACLRTAADARWIRQQVMSKSPKSVLVEGAGPLGCEIATSLNTFGVHVQLVEADRLPMRRLLGPELGIEVAKWAVDEGIDLRLERHIRAAEKSVSGRFIVELSDGATLHPDLALSAIGMTPASELAAGWASADGRGIHCDTRHRVLDPDGVAYERIYAIGDVAAVAHQVSGARVHRESWTNAVESGTAVAADILGETPPVLGRPYFWTEVFGRKVQVLGDVPMNPSPPTVLAEYPERKGGVYRFDHDGMPAAWVAVNAPRDFAMIIRDEQIQQAMK